ncbi:hypothetical protein Cgig2_005869 [Carnegiea gigantea]|uniref:RRM domain-containing protein n=1 Tax=Carnegiea gigantea TaxID=171969 RepID=A0A9Q1QKT4_9CARY|nr:hypothetical protein Cgig2_005869 [Carnegiea gigantea]
MDLSITNFKDLFSSCGEVLDAYIPNKFGRKSGIKYGFIADIQEDLKAIELLNNRRVGDCKLHVMWVRYQKRLSSRGRMGSSSTRKKTVWKWIPKAKNVPNQHSSSPYKQALLSNPNGDGLEGHKSANEVVEEDVRENLSDNSKTTSQPFNNVHSHPIYVGKFPSQVPSCGSSMEDDENIDSSLRTFDDRLEIELQLHEKSERCKVSSKGSCPTNNRKTRRRNSLCNVQNPLDLAAF